jgi:hypothetical protein
MAWSSKPVFDGGRGPLSVEQSKAILESVKNPGETSDRRTQVARAGARGIARRRRCREARRDAQERRERGGFLSGPR